MAFTGTGPLLVLICSTQSGLKTMPDAAGTWLTCYIGSDTYPWIFAGDIDLTNMQVGDTVEIELAKQLYDGGGYIVGPLNSYSGVQSNPLKHISAHANVYGVRVRARQTAGVARSFYMGFFEAKR